MLAVELELSDVKVIATVCSESDSKYEFETSSSRIIARFVGHQCPEGYHH